MLVQCRLVGRASTKYRLTITSVGKVIGSVSSGKLANWQTGTSKILAQCRRASSVSAVIGMVLRNQKERSLAARLALS